MWDPFGTLRGALWIGGGQWAGKSTVARILALRYGLTAYHYDYHDARGHQDRPIARRVRLGEPPTDPDTEDAWVNAAPEQMAADTLAGFPIRFEWALDDLRPGLWQAGHRRGLGAAPRTCRPPHGLAPADGGHGRHR